LPINVISLKTTKVIYFIYLELFLFINFSLNEHKNQEINTIASKEPEQQDTPARARVLRSGDLLLKELNEIQNEFVSIGDYTADITSMEVLDELHESNSELFNKDEIIKEVNQRLDQLCTTEAIERKVRTFRALNPKVVFHKRITLKERKAAIQQIKQENILKVRLIVIQTR